MADNRNPRFQGGGKPDKYSYSVNAPPTSDFPIGASASALGNTQNIPVRGGNIGVNYTSKDVGTSWNLDDIAKQLIYRDAVDIPKGALPFIPQNVRGGVGESRLDVHGPLGEQYAKGRERRYNVGATLGSEPKGLFDIDYAGGYPGTQVRGGVNLPFLGGRFTGDVTRSIPRRGDTETRGQAGFVFPF